MADFGLNNVKNDQFSPRFLIVCFSRNGLWNWNDLLILEEYLILWFRYFVSNCNWNCWLNLWISMWSMVHSWKYLQFFNVTNVHFRVLKVDLRRHYGGSMIKDTRKSSISSKFQAWVRGEVNSFYDNMKVW